ncbi:unnamed protein product [Notodromas monacha]|uniref:Uncharacterized protein n=1 Tax=Notodromas monacha TaxID=399045 RepID=A0A7R9BF38_9CRUS|nr:unnamed protein product [Notodromas monacha]CAG0914232.1 unnamed protein product [Notodromas monacha]
MVAKIEKLQDLVQAWNGWDAEPQSHHHQQQQHVFTGLNPTATAFVATGCLESASGASGGAGGGASQQQQQQQFFGHSAIMQSSAVASHHHHQSLHHHPHPQLSYHAGEITNSEPSARNSPAGSHDSRHSNKTVVAGSNNKTPSTNSPSSLNKTDK